MENLKIALAIVASWVFLAFLALGTFIMIDGFPRTPMHVIEQESNDSVDLDFLHFWSITPEAIQAEDPDGWAVFVQQTRTDGEIRAGVRNDMRAWALLQRHAIFLRRFGYPYEGSDIE